MDEVRNERRAFDASAHTFPVQGLDCCSDEFIGFHNVEPIAMSVAEFLTYYAHPYSSRLDFLRSVSIFPIPTDGLLKMRMSAENRGWVWLRMRCFNRC